MGLVSPRHASGPALGKAEDMVRPLDERGTVYASHTRTNAQGALAQVCPRGPGRTAQNCSAEYQDDDVPSHPIDGDALPGLSDVEQGPVPYRVTITSRLRGVRVTSNAGSWALLFERLVGCEPFDRLTGDICDELEVLVIV
jgi:hypothetical protein